MTIITHLHGRRLKIALENEAKLRSFQIRLNLKSIVTNVQLHGVEIVDSNYCVFCLEEPETIMHLFCNCKFVDTVRFGVTSQNGFQ